MVVAHVWQKSVWSDVCADSWWIFKQHRGPNGQPSRRAGEKPLRDWRELSADGPK